MSRRLTQIQSHAQTLEKGESIKKEYSGSRGTKDWNPTLGPMKHMLVTCVGRSLVVATVACTKLTLCGAQAADALLPHCQHTDLFWVEKCATVGAFSKNGRVH